MIQNGSIVTVIEDGRYFCGFQGFVEKENPEGTFRLKFGRHREGDVQRHVSMNGESVLDFMADELREDPEFTPENRARDLFPNVAVYRVWTLGGSVETEKLCMRKGCKDFRSRRIMVNAWGTVCEADTCEKCGDDFHGKRVDEFPYKE